MLKRLFMLKRLSSLPRPFRGAASFGDGGCDGHDSASAAPWKLASELLDDPTG